jgi:hypothetical protein
MGVADPETVKRLRPYQAWQNAVCGDNPNVFVPSPNSQPPCEGLVSAAPVSPFGAKYPTYPGLGTGYSTGVAGPLVYQGSLVPVGSIASYARPGPAGFITLTCAAVRARRWSLCRSR